MNRSKHYVVYGNPVPLARARYARGRFYDMQKHLKLLWGISIKEQHNKEPYFEGPISMDVIFYMPITRHVTLKRKHLYVDQWYAMRPDNTNLAKFIEDAIETITYKDDCIIVKHSIEKVYDDGKGPRTEFILQELTEKRPHRNLI